MENVRPSIDMNREKRERLKVALNGSKCMQKYPKNYQGMKQ